MVVFLFFSCVLVYLCFFFFQAEDGIRDGHVTGVQTCALPISLQSPVRPARRLQTNTHAPGNLHPSPAQIPAARVAPAATPAAVQTPTHPQLLLQRMTPQTPDPPAGSFPRCKSSSPMKTAPPRTSTSPNSMRG